MERDEKEFVNGTRNQTLKLNKCYNVQILSQKLASDEFCGVLDVFILAFQEMLLPFSSVRKK